MHKRTRACAISKKTKDIVYKRDQGCCIFCGAPGLPEAHVIARSQGGLGIEQNIVTVCRICHDKMDNSTDRKRMLNEAADYLKRFYPDWNPKDLVYDKWHKDKGKEIQKDKKISVCNHLEDSKGEKSQKDKGEPPKGFYFIGGDEHE